MSTNEEDALIKTPKQLVIVILCAFIFPITAIVLLAQYASGGISADNRNVISSQESVIKRIKPVGVLLGDSSLQARIAQNKKNVKNKKDNSEISTTLPTAASDGPDKIEGIYSSSCSACHTSGAAGAPKLGDKQAWEPRVESGIEVLYNSAINGKKAMPPKGGNSSLSNEDVKAVVDYMVSKIK
ncbi:MAG: cytochrome c, class I [Nitrosomonadaceae bacterium]|nr:cytochrome c, class I [Nitrosomonadaceae bacterium]